MLILCRHNMAANGWVFMKGGKFCTLVQPISEAKLIKKVEVFSFSPPFINTMLAVAVFVYYHSPSYSNICFKTKL
jgi:hypothetical protein